MPHLDRLKDTAPKSWLDIQHPEFMARAAKWAFAHDHYTVEVLDEAKIDKYLIKRAQGESTEAFRERKDLADYTPHFSALVDSLAGMIFNVESAAKRMFNKALGTPEDTGSIMGRLWQDADLKGNGWLTVFKMLATGLVHSQSNWILVEGGETGDARVRLLPPLMVDNWREEDGRLVEVKIIDPQDSRMSIKDPTAWKETWVVFGLEGWTRWVKVKASDGKVHEQEIDSGTYRFEDQTGNRVLPIFRSELPLGRMVGYILARKANVIFNKESHRDHLLTVAHFPKLQIVGDNDFFDQVVKALVAGSNVLQKNPDFPGDHAYIHPSAEPATILTNVLAQKRDEFWRTGFREYGDSARERTATEVRQDVASGVAAFLQLLKAALDDSENQVVWRVAQVEFPEDRSKWFGSRIERSEDFLPPDIDVVIQNLRVRYFGETTPVPIGREALIQVTKKIADFDGLEPSDAELAAAVDAQALTQALGLLSTLTVPAEIKAKMSIRNLMALGYIDPEETIDVENEGEVTKVLLSEVLETKALQIAQAEEDAALNRELMFGAPPA